MFASQLPPSPYVRQGTKTGIYNQIGHKTYWVGVCHDKLRSMFSLVRQRHCEVTRLQLDSATVPRHSTITASEKKAENNTETQILTNGSEYEDPGSPSPPCHQSLCLSICLSLNLSVSVSLSICLYLSIPMNHSLTV